LSRRGWAVVILSAWALSFAWLVKREFFRTTGERLVEAALAVPPGTVFYRLDLAGQQVGFASTTIDTVGTLLDVIDVRVIEFPLLGKLHRTRVRSRAIRTRLPPPDPTSSTTPTKATCGAASPGRPVLQMTLVSGDLRPRASPCASRSC
jgi:hypothetical protein